MFSHSLIEVLNSFGVFKGQVEGVVVVVKGDADTVFDFLKDL